MKARLWSIDRRLGGSYLNEYCEEDHGNRGCDELFLSRYFRLVENESERKGNSTTQTTVGHDYHIDIGQLK